MLNWLLLMAVVLRGINEMPRGTLWTLMRKVLSYLSLSLACIVIYFKDSCQQVAAFHLRYIGINFAFHH